MVNPASEPCFFNSSRSSMISGPDDNLDATARQTQKNQRILRLEKRHTKVYGIHLCPARCVSPSPKSNDLMPKS